MELLRIVFDVIDMRSFSNLWYWIALAVLWSTTSHWVIGVPWDMVVRARRRGGPYMDDLEDITRVNVTRIRLIGQVSGSVLTVFSSAILAILGLTGFLYRVEFAQAVFLMLFPLAIVGALSVRTANRMYDENPGGELLCRRLAVHRFCVQLIGMLSIFVTAIWGMYRNLFVGPFGY